MTALGFYYDTMTHRKMEYVESSPKFEVLTIKGTFFDT